MRCSQTAQAKALALCALFVVVLVWTGSCLREPTLAEKGPIRIGIVLPQTGTLGPLGKTFIQGIQVALQEINAAGGPLPGQLVELVFFDTETKPEVAAPKAREAVEKGAVAIIGDAGSGGSLEIYTKVTAMARIPQVSPSSTSPALTEATSQMPLGDRFFFRTVPSDALQGKVIAKFAIQRDCTRLAILHNNDAYGRPFAEALERDFRAAGRMVVAKIAFEDDQPSYFNEARMTAMANPDCVALIAYPETGARILREYMGMSGAPTVTWLAGDGLYDSAFLTEAGPALLSRLRMFGSSPDTNPDTPEYANFAQRYRAFFGEEPGLFVANAYDAMVLLCLAIARAKSTEGAKIMESVRALNRGTIVRPGELAEALALLQMGRDVNYQGASGPVDVSETGDVISDFVIWRISADGQRFEIEQRIRAVELN